MAFENAQAILAGGPSARNVPPTLVRYKGKETFTMGASATSASIPFPVGAPAQVFTLDRAHSDQDPNDHRYQFAYLIFQGSIDDFHHNFFDACTVLTQTMDVDGNVGPVDLHIVLSCTEHPKQLSDQLKKLTYALGAAAVALVAVFLFLARRIFAH